jgi:hypothetical protein
MPPLPVLARVASADARPRWALLEVARAAPAGGRGDELDLHRRRRRTFT